MRKLLLVLITLALVALPVYSATGGGTVTVAASIPAHGKPTAGLAGAGAGLCDNGAHLIKVAFVSSTGVSALSAASDAVTVSDKAADGKISVTLVASARTEVTSINIYMTKAAGSVYYLAKSGNANSNGAVVVSVADASLTAVAPSADTASAAANTTVSCTSTKAFRSLWVHNLDATNKVYITLDGTDPVTSATVGSWSIAAGATWGPIELPYDKAGNEVTSVKMRFDTTGGVVQYWYREDY